MHKVFSIFILSLTLTLTISAQDNTGETMSADQFYYTYQQSSGNHFIEGIGSFPNVSATDIRLENTPLWVLGAGNSIYVTLDNGDLVTITNGEVVSTVESTTAPLALDSEGNLLPRFNLGSRLSHTVHVAEGYFVDIQETGNLLLYRGIDVLDELELNIQTDGRVVVSEDGRIAVYANAGNSRYVHGIMGDDIEGSSLVVLHIVDDKLEIIQRIDLEGDAVFEGLHPMWADVNEDGIQDLITTVSDSQVGSRIRAYLFTDGATLIVEGQSIGRPGRWQHQLAWGAFGANGEMQLVEVLTPHIGGVVRFYEFTGSELTIVAQTGGYTSHVIDSRNLDMAIAGDFNGDAQPEIVLPSQDRTRIAGISNGENGARVVWELPLSGTLVTNIEALNTENGLILIAGRADGSLRVWSARG